MQHKQVSSAELAVHSLSFNDYNATLFKWNGGLYRGIQPQVGELYRDLFQRGIVETLVAKKLLVETELASLVVEDYPLVLQHRQLPFVSYPWEWCDLMLKDAALLHLDFCLELEQYGLTTGDAHPLNILFDGCQPLFIDFGSIELRSPDSSYWLWAPYEQFCHFFLNPLKLMAQGKGRVARWLLHDYEQGILNDDLEAFATTIQPRSYLSGLKSALKQQVPEAIILWLKQLRTQVASDNTAQLQSRRQFIEQIRQEIVDIELIAVDNLSPNLNIDWFEINPVDSNNRSQLITTILADLQPSSLLEIDNYNLQLAPITDEISQVVFITSEAQRARQVYQDARNAQLSVLPLLFNFVSPSCDLANRWFAPASDRLKCELVLALDLLDRLVFKQYLSFATIVERLAVFSTRWLLVEFIARKPPYRIKWSGEQDPDNLASRFDWYTLENFITSLEKEFSQVTTIENLADQRVLLLCEK